jgi:uncharacterized protein YdcH (DUF465 family)
MEGWIAAFRAALVSVVGKDSFLVSLFNEFVAIVTARDEMLMKEIEYLQGIVNQLTQSKEFANSDYNSLLDDYNELSNKLIRAETANMRSK